MSERLQRTAASMRETMLNHYDDTLHHKHDKYHLQYRQHWPSHPAKSVKIADGRDIEKGPMESTGLIRKRNLQKLRKRFDKNRAH